MTYPSNHGVTADQLRAFFERIERLHEERQAIGDDIKEVFAEAKGNGFDVKAMKIVLQKRRMDHADRLEQEAIVELYMSALGMVPADDSLAHVHAHAREPVRHDADAQGVGGAVSDSQPAADDAQSVASRGSDAEVNGATDVDVDDEGGLANTGGEDVTPAKTGTAGGAADASPAPIRPYCLRPKSCDGLGRNHCNGCLLKARAHAEGEAA